MLKEFRDFINRGNVLDLAVAVVIGAAFGGIVQSFVKDILIRRLNELRLYAFEFKGYWRPLSTIQLYYRANMELLDPAVRFELFVKNGKIFTKVKDEPPAKYNEEADVKNAIVADGCIIEGTVENSILFRGVKIRRGAVVRNSIIMQDAVISRGAEVENCILDKQVTLRESVRLIAPSSYPLVVAKNLTI